MRVKLGTVGHFGIAVPDPDASAMWWRKNFTLEEIFRFEGGIALSNDSVTIVLNAGKAHPKTFGHMSFHVANMATLRRALATLRKNKVDLEDPGDEIGPEGPGSPNMGLWFHDPDGYRWELSVQNGAPKRKRRLFKNS
jgi:catechol 2,3-dioxygenase-like lactoylglutathione lyase family enzyme